MQEQVCVNVDGRTESVLYDFGNDLRGAILKFGEDGVFDAFRDGRKLRVQGVARQAVEKAAANGNANIHEAAQKAVDAWKLDGMNFWAAILSIPGLSEDYLVELVAESEPLWDSLDVLALPADHERRLRNALAKARGSANVSFVARLRARLARGWGRLAPWVKGRTTDKER